MLASAIDFILHIDQHLLALSAQYGVWIYAILFLIVFCEIGLIVTPLLPGDSLLFAVGGIAALGGMDIHLMVALLSLAAILGDALNFTVGKYFGGRLFANPDSKIFRREYLDKTHRFYEKHGGKTIIIARFMPIVRTLPPSSPVWGKCTMPNLSATTSSVACCGLSCFLTRAISLPTSPS